MPDINIISETKYEKAETKTETVVYDKDLLQQQERELVSRIQVLQDGIPVLEAELSDVRTRLATFDDPEVTAAISVYVEAQKPIVLKVPVIPNP